MAYFKSGGDDEGGRRGNDDDDQKMTGYDRKFSSDYFNNIYGNSVFSKVEEECLVCHVKHNKKDLHKLCRNGQCVKYHSPYCVKEVALVLKRHCETRYKGISKGGTKEVNDSAVYVCLRCREPILESSIAAIGKKNEDIQAILDATDKPRYALDTVFCNGCRTPYLVYNRIKKKEKRKKFTFFAGQKSHNSPDKIICRKCSIANKKVLYACVCTDCGACFNGGKTMKKNCPRWERDKCRIDFVEYQKKVMVFNSLVETVLIDQLEGEEERQEKDDVLNIDYGQKKSHVSDAEKPRVSMDTLDISDSMQKYEKNGHKLQTVVQKKTPKRKSHVSDAEKPRVSMDTLDISDSMQKYEKNGHQLQTVVQKKNPKRKSHEKAINYLQHSKRFEMTTSTTSDDDGVFKVYGEKDKKLLEKQKNQEFKKNLNQEKSGLQNQSTSTHQSKEESELSDQLAFLKEKVVCNVMYKNSRGKSLEESVKFKRGITFSGFLRLLKKIFKDKDLEDAEVLFMGEKHLCIDEKHSFNHRLTDHHSKKDIFVVCVAT